MTRSKSARCASSSPRVPSPATVVAKPLARSPFSTNDGDALLVLGDQDAAHACSSRRPVVRRIERHDDRERCALPEL